VGDEPDDRMDDEAAEESAVPASPETPGKLQKCASEPNVATRPWLALTKSGRDRKVTYANDHVDSSDAIEQGV